MSAALALSGCVAQVASPGATNTPVTTSVVAPPTTTTQAPAQNTQPGTAASLEATVESVYSQVNSSVVNVQVLLGGPGASPIFPPGHPSVTPTPTLPGLNSALGSGLVWDNQGHIVTNNHVVDGATRITVTFYDGTEVDGSLVGTDPDSDLAVIKVDVPSSQLNPVKVGYSTQLKVGQLAIAIGNPFGLQGTMTVGFISGVGRVVPNNSSGLGPSYSIPDIIQTDASINPGNSGGALLDDAGLLVGVTYSIETTSGTSAGVGFAIPSSIVQQVAPALINTGHYDHPYLGVSITPMDPDLAKAMNLSSNQRGALVQGVTAGGPADKAGIQASKNQAVINGLPANVGGDIIIAYNGQPIKTADDLIAILARTGTVGQTVTLTVLRGGKEVQVPVILGARPAS